MQRAGILHYALCLFSIFWFVALVTALSISFPPSGMPVAASEAQNITWKRDKNDPNAGFFFQKIRLDDASGPSPKSTPVPIDSSTGNGGTSPFMFNQKGLFQLIAVDDQNEVVFFSTEVTVLANPTSSGAPPETSSSLADKNDATHSTSSTSTTGLSSKASSTSTGKSTPMMNMNASVGAMPSMTPTPSPSSISTETAAAALSPTSSSSSDSAKQTAAIVGGIAGGVGIPFIIGVVLLYLRYRTRRGTSHFSRKKMVRDYSPGLHSAGWINGSEKDLDLEDNLPRDLPPVRAARSPRDTLRPQDSISNVAIGPAYVLPIIPRVPAPQSVTNIGTSYASKSSALSLSTLLSASTNASSVSGTLFPVPVSPPRARTERQMLVEDNIQRLQARTLYLQGREDISRLEREKELKEIHAKVDRLKKVHESDWALGLTDDVAEGM